MDTYRCHAILRSAKQGLHNLCDPVIINLSSDSLYSIPKPPLTSPNEKVVFHTEAAIVMIPHRGGTQAYVLLSAYTDYPRSISDHNEALTKVEGSVVRYWIGPVALNSYWTARGCRLLRSRLTTRSFSQMRLLFGAPNPDNSWLYRSLLPRRLSAAVRICCPTHFHIWIAL